MFRDYLVHAPNFSEMSLSFDSWSYSRLKPESMYEFPLDGFPYIILPPKTLFT